LDAAERDPAEAPQVFRVGFAFFRVGFLAALRVGFFAPAAALVAFRFVVFSDGFLAAAAFFFFFGDADAGFDFRFTVVGRFLAAPIAAPESAPITVPMTGRPTTVPATAQRLRRLARSQWCPRVCQPYSLSCRRPCSSPQVGEKTLDLSRLPVNERYRFIHWRVPAPSNDA